MRDLVLKMFISVDGFVASSHGDTTWMFSGDPEARAWSVATVASASLHVMGSTTFADMAQFWPTSTDVFASPMNDIPKAVFSKRGTEVLRDVPPGPGNWDRAYVASGDLAEEIAKLKAVDGKPIIAHGGAAFARSLIANGLVDRYALLVLPLALGKGLPIFSDVAGTTRLSLIGSTAFPKGSFAQIYRPSSS